MTAHRKRQHRIDPAINWDWLPVSQTDLPPQVFEVSFPRVMTKYQCPFPGCPGSSHTWICLRNHFKRHHWRDSMIILNEHLSLFPHCDRCGRKVLPWILNNWHYTTEQFRLGEELRRQWETLHHYFEVSKLTIRVNPEPLETNSAFP